MSDITYHIKIKKEYASAVLDDLQQADAIEILRNAIPEWQQQEKLKRLKQMKGSPDEIISHEDYLKLFS